MTTFKTAISDRKSWILAFFISATLGLLMLLVYNTDLMSEGAWYHLSWLLVSNIVIGLVYFWYLWSLVEYLNRRLPWVEHPGKRFIVELGGVLLIVLNVSIGAYVWYGLMEGWIWTKGIQYYSLRLFISSTYLPVLVTLFMEARWFLFNWKETLLRAERLKFSNLEAQHDYLRQQIKPHFLFNSLNVLASLVHKDADLAEKFVLELSALYRRLLEMHDRDTVSLREELTAFESYVFLMKMRFGDALKVEIQAPDVQDNYVIPPFTLQLLLENAVKHNEMSQSNPITVQVEMNEPCITVRNTRKPKLRPTEPSTGIGLDNLKKRYQLLSDQPLEVVSDATTFLVKVPILSA